MAETVFPPFDFNKQRQNQYGEQQIFFTIVDL
jgi:hypothetical protein